jgi:hypothetical protein
MVTLLLQAGPALGRRRASDLARLIRLGEVSAREVVEADVARPEGVNLRLGAMIFDLLDRVRSDYPLAQSTCS